MDGGGEADAGELGFNGDAILNQHVLPFGKNFEIITPGKLRPKVVNGVIIVKKEWQTKPRNVDNPRAKIFMRRQAGVWQVINVPIHDDFGQENRNGPQNYSVQEMAAKPGRQINARDGGGHGPVDPNFKRLARVFF